MKSRKNAQKGFTLVEIAIVLVIIGLLLGGVLRGQELIDSGKTRQIVNDFNSMTAAYYSYQDRYRATPGDDRVAHGFTNAGPAAGATAGNGTIELTGNVFASATAGENNLFWGHLRYAGFIKGPVDSTANAQANAINAFDLLYGVRPGAGTYGNIPATNVICAAVPYKAAQAIDSNLDDGLPNNGNVRGGNAGAAAPTNVTGAAAVSYLQTNNFYGVCKAL